MTWFTLFTSWQFWLVIIVNSFVCMLIPGFMSFNRLSKEGEELPPVDITLEIVSLRSEVQRLTDANFALNMQNVALEREINLLDSGPGDYEPKQRPNEAFDG